MAARVPFREIQLSELDVPGAILRHPDPSANSVTSLQRFLQVRGVKFPAATRKAELIQLVLKYQSKPVDNSVDHGKWLEAKTSAARRSDLNNAAAAVIDVDVDGFDVFPVFGWGRFCHVDIPSLFNYGVIHQYIVETREVVSDDSEDASDDDAVAVPASTKPLSRGKRYFVSGHVGELEDARSSKGHYCLKAKIQASMTNVKYSVMVMLHGVKGLVLDASCECKASAMARCSHVGALLIALEDYTVLYGHTAKACTSQLCAWNQGRKTKQSHPINMRQYNCKRDPTRATSFTVFEPFSPQATVDRVKFQLQLLVPNAVWADVLQFGYAEYELSAERIDVLISQRAELLETLKFRASGPKCITSGQTSSEEWHRIRRLLITASNFSTYLHDGSKSKKLHDLMYDPPKLENVYVKYGQDNEDKARLEYTKQSGNEVSCTGLWINPNFPGLGASPDGLVYSKAVASTSTQAAVGLLEIKCPYVMRNFAPADTHLLTPQQRYAYCLKWQDGVVQLSKSHKYWGQVQIQLGVTGFQWCDFVVWTKKGIFIQRIHKDDAWWESTAAALSRFHAEFICAEYFELRIPRRLDPVRLPIV